MTDIVFTQNQAVQSDIERHFNLCDQDFLRDLSSRVDLKNYIEKILSKSIRYEAWAGRDLVGILAVYNGHDFDFITNVSVTKKFAQKGIASTLLAECISQAKNSDIKLEVSKSNAAALALYHKFGFITEREDERSYYLNFKAGNKP